MLIADFDKEGWHRETALYRDACRTFGLVPAVERSRSGNGSHVWLFFEEPIEAELARNLGCALITHAMSQAAGMSFEPYDRFFPTQSTIPEGGFGNLIALPFQGRPQRQSNSVFVDDGFEPYPDQWRFLSSVTKASLQQIREIVDSSVAGPLGQLAFASHPSRKASEPTGVAYAAVSLQASDSSPTGFPKTVSVTKANMLFVSKQGLSNKAQNRIRRLAAFGAGIAAAEIEEPDMGLPGGSAQAAFGEFASRHLGFWAPRFRDAVADEAEEPFYLWASETLKLFLEALPPYCDCESGEMG